MVLLLRSSLVYVCTWCRKRCGMLCRCRQSIMRQNAVKSATKLTSGPLGLFQAGPFLCMTNRSDTGLVLY